MNICDRMIISYVVLGIYVISFDFIIQHVLIDDGKWKWLKRNLDQWVLTVQVSLQQFLEDLFVTCAVNPCFMIFAVLSLLVEMYLLEQLVNLNEVL